MKNRTYNKKKIMIVFFAAVIMIIALLGRMIFLMIFDAEYYQKRAKELHERERKIKAARGEILDRNGVVLATNKTVCTISVIHNQIKNKEQTIQMLSKELGLEEAYVRKRVEKISSMEKIKTNVEKEVGDRIRNLDLDGVKVDEDFKRYYPYGELASQVLGFTGGDNRGIIGLEVKYEEYLKGVNGTILTMTDARGIELEGVAEDRMEPKPGNTLEITMDYNIQSYCEQAAKRVMEEKEADAVAIILMDPQNGEIYAMANVPEFNLNDPFTLSSKIDTSELTDEKKQDLLNQMWRNRCINDTYEPGSTFKVITSAACLEEGVVTVNDMEIGLRLGADKFYDYFQKFGLLKLTNVDLPGEAGTIMHKKEDIGLVELATMTFGQSFQITPIQLLTTISSIINGGTRITPHFGKKVYNSDGKEIKTLTYQKQKEIVSKETSETMKMLLESVVSEGSGHNAYLEGYRIGGKTATSQTLPRSANKYISSFVGFAPANDPKVIGMVIIYDPKGIYYGGTIAAPVLRDIYDNVLPYLEKQEK